MHTSNSFSLVNMLALESAFAYVPDAKEQCEIDASAICEVNGVEYLSKDPCPGHAKTVLAAKDLDCSVAPPSTQISPQPAQRVSESQQPQGFSLPSTTKSSPSWLPFFALLTTMVVVAVLVLRSRYKSSGHRKFKITIRWAAITALSVVGGILGARLTFYQTYEHIHNREGSFAALAALAAGVCGFLVIGTFIGFLTRKILKP